MGRFLKKEVLEKTDTFKKLSAIGPADKKNQKNPKHVDIGFAARGTFKKGTEKKELQVNYVFYLSKMIASGVCLSAIVIKLLERSPLKYSGSEFGDCHVAEVGIRFCRSTG